MYRLIYRRYFSFLRITEFDPGFFFFWSEMLQTESHVIRYFQTGMQFAYSSRQVFVKNGTSSSLSETLNVLFNVQGDLRRRRQSCKKIIHILNNYNNHIAHDYSYSHVRIRSSKFELQSVWRTVLCKRWLFTAANGTVPVIGRKGGDGRRSFSRRSTQSHLFI